MDLQLDKFVPLLIGVCCLAIFRPWSQLNGTVKTGDEKKHLFTSIKVLLKSQWQEEGKKWLAVI